VKAGKVATKWAENLVEGDRSQQAHHAGPLPVCLGIMHIGESTAKTLAAWLGRLDSYETRRRRYCACCRISATKWPRRSPRSSSRRATSEWSMRCSPAGIVFSDEAAPSPKAA
jgi:DNA ligase (NAD+)